jgi:hypothetical protein
MGRAPPTRTCKAKLQTQRTRRTQRCAGDRIHRVKPRATWRGAPSGRWGSTERHAGAWRRGPACGDPTAEAGQARGVTAMAVLLCPGGLGARGVKEAVGPAGERLRGGEAGAGKCTRDDSEPPAPPTRTCKAKLQTQRTQSARRCAEEGLGAVGPRPRGSGVRRGAYRRERRGRGGVRRAGGHGPRGTGYAARRADVPTPSRTSRIDPAEPKG